MNLRKKALLLLCSCLLGCAVSVQPVFAQTVAGDEYSIVGYNEQAVDNPVAKLAARIEGGDFQLDYEGERGFFDSFLQALEIDFSSQVLVFSKTSLQYRLISPTAPRGLYFSDDTYIGLVQNSDIIEIATIDSRQGLVFYTLSNVKDEKPSFERVGQACLVCHDSAGAMGGGVPLLMGLSSLYREDGANLQDIGGDFFITDQTPIEDRWGGWYVTGQHGKQKHLGNILLKSAAEIDNLDEARKGNIDTLDELALFDSTPYPTNTSDIVALMVLEHQMTIQNQITYVKFKAPAVLSRLGFPEANNASSWAELPERGQRSLTRMLDELVQLLFMVDAAEFADDIHGSAEYEAWFTGLGKQDAAGRSLRDLDLETRLFQYPMSYLIYSENFETLPAYVKDYIYRQFSDVLKSRSNSDTNVVLSDSKREAVLQILRETKPDFVEYLTE